MHEIVPARFHQHGEGILLWIYDVIMNTVPGFMHMNTDPRYQRTNIRQKGDAMLLDILKTTLETVQPGEPVNFKSLTLFPLYCSTAEGETTGETSSRFVLLQDAIATGTAKVTEVSDSGSVPDLKVTNTGTCPILILEGEIVVGGKQNRTVNITIIVPPKSDYVLPVTCVEQGRWSQEAEFTADYYAPPALRSKKVQSAQWMMKSGGEARADQMEVWNEVAFVLDDLEAESKTTSLTDGFKSREDNLKEYEENLKLDENACGFVMTTGDTILGMDLFDAPQTLAAVWPRLSKAYFLQSLTRQKGEEDEPPETEPEEMTTEAITDFLKSLPESARIPDEASGTDIYIELANDDYVGTGTFHNGGLCHLAVFPKPPESTRSYNMPGEQAPLQQASIPFDQSFTPESEAYEPLEEEEEGEEGEQTDID